MPTPLYNFIATVSSESGTRCMAFSTLPPATEVTDDGEVVEKAMQRQRPKPGE